MYNGKKKDYLKNEVLFMGLGNIGIPGLVLILVMALIIFGPKKLPEIGKAAGQTLREFKNSASDLMNDHDKKDSNSNKDSNQKEL